MFEDMYGGGYAVQPYDNMGKGGGIEMMPVQEDVVPYERMLELGFEPIVLDTRNAILYNFGKLSNRTFELGGVWDYRLRQDILYADKIIKGIIPVDNKEDLKKHLKKMNFERKISIADLAVSIAPHNELKAIIRGLPEKSLFGIYNTNPNDEQNTSVDIDTLSPKYITIWSDKYYRIGQKQSRKLFRVKDLLNNRQKYYTAMEDIEKSIRENPASFKIERVAELLNVRNIKGKNMVSVVIHRDYCRVLGRYMIVASLKAPDQHLGAYELISLGGTTVYVFAKQVKYNQKADVKYSTGAERVYYISSNEEQLDTMLQNVTNQVYQKIRGVYSERIEATTDFVSIEPWVADKSPDGEGGDSEGGSEDTGTNYNTDADDFF